jgi:transcriptional regulator with XRE-family HTH domain
MSMSETTEVIEEMLALTVEKGMTQYEVADKLGVNQCQVSKWKLGKAHPSRKYLARIRRYVDELKGEIVKVEEESRNFIATAAIDPIVLDIFKENQISGPLKIKGLNVTKDMIRLQGCQVLVRRRDSGMYEEINGSVWHPSWLKHIAHVGSDKAKKATRLVEIQKQILDLTNELAELQKEFE